MQQRNFFQCYDPRQDVIFPRTVRARYVDVHVHGRRTPLTEILLPQKAARTCGGFLEPNTKPHLIDYDSVMRCLEHAHHVAPGKTWKASLYLTMRPHFKDTERLHRNGLISHVKHYPEDGTTHSESGVHPEVLLDENSQPGKYMRHCESLGLPVKRHAEVPKYKGIAVDAYDREALDLSEYEPRLIDLYPRLRRILAHMSTDDAVRHMEKYGDPDKYICELPPVHANCDRRILFDGGSILSDHHCLPVLKGAYHLRSLQDMVQRKPKWLVAGSDSAGHTNRGKYAFLGFGGLNVYGCDLELYMEMLASLNVLDYADDFLYGNAKRFFGDLVPNDPEWATLRQEEWTVDETIPVPGTDGEYLTPFGYHPDTDKRKRFMYRLVEA